MCAKGEDALKPQMVNERWRRPVVSKRVAADLRKQAVRDGTYGSFDATTGVGWDPAWDGARGQPMHLRKPKVAKHHRTREERAQRIEAKLETMDEKIEEYYKAKHENKPPDDFESRFKRLMRKKS